MPELPEVETIARGLSPLLVGRRVTGLDVLDNRVFPGDVRTFRREFTGRLITGVRRRAKVCLVEVEGGRHIAFHLKMTGRLLVPAPGMEPDRHLRVVIELDDVRALHFVDMRRFGLCLGFGPGGLSQWDFFRRLGPEPLDMSTARFRRLMTGRSGRVKALLLDQEVIAGIGNIYADESLFLAGINPLTRADALTPKNLDALLGALQDVLRRAIAAGGSTIRDYRTAEGVAGSFQWNFKVYGRAGLPCPACGGRLAVTKAGGRTSTFCPRCQR